MKRARFVVFGNVQGVCYRHYSAKKARELGISGFVRNLIDGRVEVLAEGEDEKLDAFLIFCKKNPGQSCVEKLEIEEIKKINKIEFKGFEIRN